MRKQLSLTVLPAGLVALMALAGCGGSSSASTNSSSSSTTASGASTIDVAKNAQLGQILTDSNGNTLYMFAKDTNGKSECTGSCASVWPPVTTSGQPKAGNGVVASKLGTTIRSDGSTQVTYAGHPLYFYAQEGRYQVTCHDVTEYGGTWLVVRPNGRPAPG